jgi:hypothetical protein
VTVTGKVDIASVAGLRKRLLELAASGHRWWSTWIRPASSTLSGSACWSAWPGGPSRTAAACTWSASSRRSAKLFRLTGLDRRVPLARTLNEAMQALAAARSEPRLALTIVRSETRRVRPRVRPVERLGGVNNLQVKEGIAIPPSNLIDAGGSGAL